MGVYNNTFSNTFKCFLSSTQQKSFSNVLVNGNNVMTGNSIKSYFTFYLFIYFLNI